MLDPDDPITIGAMVGPEAFTEVQVPRCTRSSCGRSTRSPSWPASSAGPFGRGSGGLVRSYRSEDAEVVVVALGSVLGTIEDVVDELREEGVRIGALGITCFRPWPLDEVRAALAGA